MTEKRRSGARQTFACGMLLAVLAAGAYFSGEREQQPASPVVFIDHGRAEQSEHTLEEIRSQLDSRRQEELALLDSVIAESPAGSTREMALGQKAELVGRMECEAAAEVAASAIGAEALCLGGKGLLILYMNASQGMDESEAVRLISAVSEQTGCPAESVKIILVKNET